MVFAALQMRGLSYDLHISEQTVHRHDRKSSPANVVASNVWLFQIPFVCEVRSFGGFYHGPGATDRNFESRSLRGQYRTASATFGPLQCTGR
jgi:hypothetical protein